MGAWRALGDAARRRCDDAWGAPGGDSTRGAEARPEGQLTRACVPVRVRPGSPCASAIPTLRIACLCLNRMPDASAAAARAACRFG